MKWGSGEATSGLVELFRLLIEWRQGLQFLSEYPSFEVPHGILYLVAHVLPGADVEDLIQLLERQGLGFGNEQQDQEPERDAPRGVPPESTRRGKGCPQAWPREGDDEVETPSRRRGPGHAHVSDVHGECLGGVGEGYRAFTRRVKHLEEVHSSGDEGDPGLVSLGEERESGPEEENGKPGEREK